MNTIAILHITFGAAVIQYVAHAILFLTAKPKHGQDEINVIKAMKSTRWNFKGFKRSYWDFYFGYGLLAILFGLVEIALLWQLSIIPENSLPIIKPIIAVLLFANILHGILTVKYFFLLPAIFDLLIATLLVLTFMNV